MPHVSLTLYPGRTPEQINQMAKALRKSLVDTVGWKDSDVSVSVQERKPEEFAASVNERLTEETLILESDYVHP